MTPEEKIRIALGLLLIIAALSSWSAYREEQERKRAENELHYEPLDELEK